MLAASSPQAEIEQPDYRELFLELNADLESLLLCRVDSIRVHRNCFSAEVDNLLIDPTNTDAVVSRAGFIQNKVKELLKVKSLLEGARTLLNAYPPHGSTDVQDIDLPDEVWDGLQEHCSGAYEMYSDDVQTYESRIADEEKDLLQAELGSDQRDMNRGVIASHKRILVEKQATQTSMHAILQALNQHHIFSKDSPPSS
jgi:hypothetical protein